MRAQTNERGRADGRRAHKLLLGMRRSRERAHQPKLANVLERAARLLDASMKRFDAPALQEEAERLCIPRLCSRFLFTPKGRLQAAAQRNQEANERMNHDGG